MERHYKVAEHVFSVHAPESIFERMGQYSPFVAPDAAGSIFCLSVVESLDLGAEELVYDQPTEPGETKITLHRCSAGLVVRMSATSQHPVSGVLLMAEDYSRGSLMVMPEQDALFAVNNSLMLLFAFRTACMNTLEMHASVVQNGGKAYLFLAKSGTGKSTHSSLWLKHIPGSTLLNDDNPVVRVMSDGSVQVFGSPWSGKTPCYKNEVYPAGAFVLIRRCAQNKLTPLSVFEAYATVYSSSSGFKADGTMADGLHSTMEKVVTKVPCFVLDCRPDEEAAQVCAGGVR